MNRAEITAERLRYLMNYDPDTGLFTRRVSTSRLGKKGSIAGSTVGGGYRRVSIDGRTYGLNRLAVLWMTGRMPKSQVDHINGVTNDNRWANLREATISQNQANARLRRDSSSGLKGVSWQKDVGRWKAGIQVNRKRIHLGLFDTPEEAYAAYCKAARDAFGEFARLPEPHKQKRDALRAMGLDVRTV